MDSTLQPDLNNFRFRVQPAISLALQSLPLHPGAPPAAAGPIIGNPHATAHLSTLQLPLGSQPIRTRQRGPRVRAACDSCREAKTKCTDTRPCARCVKHGQPNRCTDTPQSNLSGQGKALGGSAEHEGSLRSDSPDASADKTQRGGPGVAAGAASSTVNGSGAAVMDTSGGANNSNSNSSGSGGGGGPEDAVKKAQSSVNRGVARRHKPPKPHIQWQGGPSGPAKKGAGAVNVAGSAYHPFGAVPFPIATFPQVGAFAAAAPAPMNDPYLMWVIAAAYWNAAHAHATAAGHSLVVTGGGGTGVAAAGGAAGTAAVGSASGAGGSGAASSDQHHMDATGAASAQATQIALFAPLVFSTLPHRSRAISPSGTEAAMSTSTLPSMIRHPHPHPHPHPHAHSHGGADDDSANEPHDDEMAAMGGAHGHAEPMDTDAIHPGHHTQVDLGWHKSKDARGPDLHHSD